MDNENTDDLRSDRTPLGARLAERLLEQIREEGLGDGDPLPAEREIGQKYGASMRVVRDALALLNQQGAIRTQQGRRAVVSELRPVAVGRYFRLMIDAHKGGLEDFIEFRAMLEVAAAGVAAQRISEDGVAGLGSLLDQLESSGMNNVNERADLDLKFHLGIASAANNQFLTAVVEALGEVLTTERQRSLSATESAGLTHDESDKEHRAILAALEGHDVELAEQMMTQHLTRVRRNLRRWQEEE